MKKRLVKLVCLVLSVLCLVGVFAFYGNSPAAMAEESPAEGKKIYFAAPLFNEAEKEYNLKIVSILESYGYEVFLPQRDGGRQDGGRDHRDDLHEGPG